MHQLLESMYGQHLVPFLNLLMKPSIEAPPASISGCFGILPMELVTVIVTAMLELNQPASHDDVLASVRCVQSFVRTCRGASLAVTREQRLEAVSRRCMQLKPLCGVTAEYAYTELSYANLRSIIECKLVRQVLLMGLTHCAMLTNTCCSIGRDRLNQSLRLLTNGGNPVQNTASHKVLGTQRDVMRVAVAAGSKATLLCQTDRGAAVCVEDVVRCVEGYSCDVYSPEGELAVTFERRIDPEIGSVMRAASYGDLLVLQVQLDDQSGVDACNTLQVWDTKSNVLLESRGVKYDPMLLWVCGETVYCLTSRASQNLTPYYEEEIPIIDHWQPRAREGSMQRKGGRWTLPPCHKIAALSVARHAGHLIMVDTALSHPREHLLFFDVDLGEVGAIDSHDTLKYPGVTSSVALSPLADTAVYLARSIDYPAVLIYRRSQHQLNRARNIEEPMGWSMCFQGNPPQCDFPSNRHYTHCSAFSPCGGEACFFFFNEQRAQYLRVNLCKTFQEKKVVANVWSVMSDVMPTSAVWSDGIYLATGHGDGIIRIGSM